MRLFFGIQSSIDNIKISFLCKGIPFLSEIIILTSDLFPFLYTHTQNMYKYICISDFKFCYLCTITSTITLALLVLSYIFDERSIFHCFPIKNNIKTHQQSLHFFPCHYPHNLNSRSICSLDFLKFFQLILKY